MQTNFFYTRHKIRMFLIQIKAYMLDIINFDEKRFMSVKNSDLGRWMQKQIIDKVNDDDVIDELMFNLENMHVYAKYIILNKSKNYTEAKKYYELLKEKARLIYKLLDKIESLSKHSH